MGTTKKEMWQAASLAMKIVSNGNIEPYSKNKKIYDEAGLTEKGVRTFVGGSGDIHAGYVGLRKDGDINVGFRGTDGTLDWINNMAVGQVPFPYCKGSKVHAGFLNAVSSISTQMVAEISKLEGSDKKIYITGHSKGGAMATLMAKILEVEITKTGKNIEVHTFGSPRVGDKIFRDLYKYTHYRYEAFLDLVPHLPFTIGELELFRRLSTGYEKIGNLMNVFGDFMLLPPYFSVGTRICLNPDHLPLGKIPVETDNSTGETLNSFCAMEEAMRKNGIGFVVDTVHNKDYPA